ncbi:MAG: hypothetical protein RIQ28_732, partial [Pseudomonadota bacterium]
MQVHFAAERPTDTDVLAFIVQKSAWDGFALPLDNPAAARETAKLARFEGNSGQSFLFFSQEGGRTVRIILVAVSDGDAADYIRAGGEILAKVQTCGAKTIAVHAANLDAKATAEVAYGAVLRNWRMDKYRTKMPETAKPTITDITLFG